jgi:AcrR family transcriptional regulator
MTRSQLRRRALRRQISNAALELFEERGFGNVTTDEIAERVHLSRRTLFRHFPSKNEILGTYGNERREEFAAIVGVKLAAGDEMPGAISDAIRADAAVWEEQRALFRRISRVLRESDRVDPQASSQRKWADTIATSLAPHVGREETDPELVVVSEAFAAAFRVAQYQWYTRDARGSLVELLTPTLPLAETLYRASTLPTRSTAARRGSDIPA